MKTLIVDDEPLPRAELRRMLRAFDDIEVVGEASDAVQASDLIERLSPDLVFLDVQMPEKSGLELLASLTDPPRIVFVTAHDTYAIKAFEFGAFDYLLKPIQETRLKRCLERIPPGTRTPPPDDDESFSIGQSSPLSMEQKVLLRDGECCFFVPVGSIHAVESCGAYSKVFFDQNAILIPRSLSVLEHRLPPDYFFRVSRQEIINLQEIVRIDPSVSGGLVLKLRSGRISEVSRRQSRLFRQRVSL